MAALTTSGPDGREWVVRVKRFHFRRYDPRYDPELRSEDDDLLFATVHWLVVAPIMWFVVPAVSVLVTAPVDLVSGLVSTRRWVEAKTALPTPIQILWRVPKDYAEEAAEHVAGRLAVAFDALAPEWAEFVAMTESERRDRAVGL